MVIVPDNAKEARKGRKAAFVITDPERADDEGAMICYPVSHGALGTPYVLTVSASEAGHFKKEHRKLYEAVLYRFAIRICLEHSLMLMKEHVESGPVAEDQP
jgi:hypothetical protein